MDEEELYKTGVDKLIANISRRGLSGDSQKLIQRVLRAYFDGDSEEMAMKYFNDKERGAVRDIYQRIEEIKAPLSKTSVSGQMGKTKADIQKDNYLFTEAALRYIFEFNDDDALKIDTEEFINNREGLSNGIRRSLESKFFGRKKSKTDTRHAVYALSKDPAFFTLIQRFNLLGRIN